MKPLSSYCTLILYTNIVSAQQLGWWLWDNNECYSGDETELISDGVVEGLLDPWDVTLFPDWSLWIDDACGNGNCARIAGPQWPQGTYVGTGCVTINMQGDYLFGCAPC